VLPAIAGPPIPPPPQAGQAQLRRDHRQRDPGPGIRLARTASADPLRRGPASGAWNGKISGYTSKLRSTVAGSHVANFSVPEAPVYCLTGFSAISVVVPSATIHGTAFSGSKNITYSGETERISLTGRFSGRTATGSVKMQGPCDGTLAWTAHR
jgi:hypothetical protein